MRVAEMLHSSKIYGPGERTVLWLQGCSIQCENCWNDELWSFQGGQSIGSDEVITYAGTHKNSGIQRPGGTGTSGATDWQKRAAECRGNRKEFDRRYS